MVYRSGQGPKFSSNIYIYTINIVNILLLLINVLSYEVGKKLVFQNYMLFDGPGNFSSIFSRPLCRDKLIGTYTPGICDALI